LRASNLKIIGYNFLVVGYNFPLITENPFKHLYCFCNFKVQQLKKEDQMETQAIPNFKIVILDDNDFYNKILTRFLSESLKKTGLLKGFTVDIFSFTSVKDCLNNLDNSVDILFTDYFLSDDCNATHIIDFINEKVLTCKVIVVSQIQNMKTCALTILAGAYEFIKKDKKTMFECNGIAEAIITEKLGVTN